MTNDKLDLTTLRTMYANLFQVYRALFAAQDYVAEHQRVEEQADALLRAAGYAFLVEAPLPADLLSLKDGPVTGMVKAAVEVQKNYAALLNDLRQIGLGLKHNRQWSAAQAIFKALHNLDPADEEITALYQYTLLWAAVEQQVKNGHFDVARGTVEAALATDKTMVKDQSLIDMIDIAEAEQLLHRGEPQAACNLSIKLLASNSFSDDASKLLRNAFHTWLDFVEIPIGNFYFGEDKRHIHLPEFAISRTLVTNAQYQTFVNATGYLRSLHHSFENNSDLDRFPDFGPSGFSDSGDFFESVFGHSTGRPYAGQMEMQDSVTRKSDHPIVNVSWEDAQAFCRWAGVRLPREEEWEKAARWIDGRTYPWGNQEPNPTLCNVNLSSGTTPVGRYPTGASPYGLLDMFGNVWEWCEDEYNLPLYLKSGRTLSRVTEGPLSRAVRGGTLDRHGHFVPCFYRSSYIQNNCNRLLGFRVVALNY